MWRCNRCARLSPLMHRWGALGQRSPRLSLYHGVWQRELGESELLTGGGEWCTGAGQVNEAAAAATSKRTQEAPFGALLTFDTFMEVKGVSPATHTHAPPVGTALASVRSLHGCVAVCCSRVLTV